MARRPLASNSREIERSQNFRGPNNKERSQSSEQQSNDSPSQINRRHPPPPRAPPLVFDSDSNSPFQPPRRIHHPTEFFPEHIRDGFPPFSEPFGNDRQQRRN